MWSLTTAISLVQGADRFCRDIEMMIGRTVPFYIRFCWCFLAPLLSAVLMVTSLVTYVPPTYGDYEYPWYAATIGWMFACSSVIPLVVVGVSVIRNSPGHTLYQKVLWSLKPTEDWQPSSKQKLYESDERSFDRKDYQTNDSDIKESFSQRLLANIGLRKEVV